MPGIKKSQSMADALLVEGRDGAVVSQKNRCLTDGANHIATIQSDYGK